LRLHFFARDTWFFIPPAAAVADHSGSRCAAPETGSVAGANALLASESSTAPIAVRVLKSLCAIGDRKRPSGKFDYKRKRENTACSFKTFTQIMFMPTKKASSERGYPGSGWKSGIASRRGSVTDSGSQTLLSRLITQKFSWPTLRASV